MDFKALSRNDQIVLGAGLVVFISSFFPWYGTNVAFINVNINAWHSYSTFALLLVFIGVGVTAAAVFAKESLTSLPVGPRVLAAGLLALGTLLEVLRLITLHHGDGVGLKWGAYILVIAMVVATVFAVLSMRESGESIPGIGGGSAPTPPAA